MLDKLAIAALILSGTTIRATAEDIALAETPLAAVSEKLTVGLLGDPTQLRFEGVKAFPEEQLRRALAGDLEYQAAARPSADLGELVRVLSSRVKEGYGKAGIRAKIDVRIDDAVVVVVKEGTPQRFGQFSVADDTKLPPELLERVQGATRRPGPTVFPARDRRATPTDQPGRKASCRHWISVRPVQSSVTYPLVTRTVASRRH